MNRIFIGIFMLLSLCTTAAFAESDTEFSPDRKKWTSNLPDTMLLCHVSIPGAHDAFTGTTRAAGTTTQALFVEEMFDKGIRFFDLRLGGWAIDGRVMLYGFHATSPLGVWFDNTMNKLYKRVQENNEFIIIEACREHSAPFWQETWKSICAYFDRHDGNNDVTHNFDYFNYYWKDRDEYRRVRDKILLPFRPDLTVGDVRGRIVYMINDDFSDKNKDMDVTKYWKKEYYADYPYVSNQPGGPKGNGTFKLWDEKQKKVIEHHYTSQNIDHVSNGSEKTDYIIDQFEYYNQQVRQHPDSTLWNFNYISGWQDWLHFEIPIVKKAAPDQREIATYCNRKAAAFIGNHPDYYYGIVAMDWACVATGWGYTMYGDVLVDAIINSNYKFWTTPANDPRSHYEVETSRWGNHYEKEK